MLDQLLILARDFLEYLGCHSVPSSTIIPYAIFCCGAFFTLGSGLVLAIYYLFVGLATLIYRGLSYLFKKFIKK